MYWYMYTKYIPVYIINKFLCFNETRSTFICLEELLIDQVRIFIIIIIG